MYILLILYIMMINISMITPKRYAKSLIILFSIAIGIISFLFIPGEEMDLFRHYQRLELLRNVNLTDLNQVYIYDSLPVIKVYLFFISKLNYNGFLPAITMFIIYLLTGMTIHKFSISYNLRKKTEIFLFLVFILTHNYLSSVSGIRNFMAFSIFFYALYKDLVEEKNKFSCFIVYLATCFIHSSVIVLIVIRLILLIKNKFFKKIVISLILIWSFFIPIITKILGKFKGIDFFEELLYKIEVYNNTGIAINIHSTLAIILITVAILIMIIISTTLTNKDENNMNKYLTYTKFLCFFIVGSINNYHVFIRFSNSLTFIIPIILGLALNKKLNNSNKIIVLCIFTLIAIMSIGLFMFQYKFIRFN